MQAEKIKNSTAAIYSCLKSVSKVKLVAALVLMNSVLSKSTIQHFPVMNSRTCSYVIFNDLYRFLMLYLYQFHSLVPEHIAVDVQIF